MSNGIGKNPLNDISKVYLEQVGKKKKKKDDSYLETDMKKRQENNEKAREDMKKMGTSMKNPHFEQKQFGWDSVNSMTKAYRAMQEGIRDEDPEKGTEERKKRLEKKRGMKMDDHPQYKKEEVELDENRRAARAAGGSKDDRKKQPDPSKDGFTGIGNMSIDQIRKMSARIDKEKKEKDQKKSVNEDAFDPGLVDRKRNRKKDPAPTSPSKNADVPNVNAKPSAGGSGSMGPMTSGGPGMSAIKAKPLATLNRGKKGDGYLGPTLSVGGYRVGIPNPIRKEALDPVGKEDGDVNNDGKKDSTDSYLMKRRKAIGSAMRKRLKEERASLSEVMTDKEDEKKVVEKKVNNTVVINPKLSEAVEELGGEVLEMVEIDEMNQGPSTPAKKYDGKFMPNPGAGRPGKVRLKPGTPASNLRLAHKEYSDWRSDLSEDDLQEIDVKGMVKGALKAGDKVMKTPVGRAVGNLLKPVGPGSGTARPSVRVQDRIRKNQAGMESVEVDGETIDERTRYAKETGKDPQTGKPSEKGGTRTGKSAFDQVSREMRKTGGVMSSRGKGIQPQGKKKEKGKKGYKGVTPVDKIRNRLSQKRKEQPNPYRARAGESD